MKRSKYCYLITQSYDAQAWPRSCISYPPQQAATGRNFDIYRLMYHSRTSCFMKGKAVPRKTSKNPRRCSITVETPGSALATPSLKCTNSKVLLSACTQGTIEICIRIGPVGRANDFGTPLLSRCWRYRARSLWWRYPGRLMKLQTKVASRLYCELRRQTRLLLNDPSQELTRLPPRVMTTLSMIMRIEIWLSELCQGKV